MYHLKKPAFDKFSKLLFYKVFDFSHNNISASKTRNKGKLLIKSLNLLVPVTISDVITNDGYYKIVDRESYKEFKGARKVKKDSVSEDGSIKKAQNAQIGLQVTYSVPDKWSLNIHICSSTDNERKYVNVWQYELHIFYAAYYSAEMIDIFDESNAYIVVRGRSNLVGRVYNVVIDGVDQSTKFDQGGDMKFNQPLFPSLGHF